MNDTEVYFKLGAKDHARTSRLNGPIEFHLKEIWRHLLIDDSQLNCFLFEEYYRT